MEKMKKMNQYEKELHIKIIKAHQRGDKKALRRLVAEEKEINRARANIKRAKKRKQHKGGFGGFGIRLNF